MSDTQTVAPITDPTPEQLGVDFARRDGYMKFLGIKRLKTGAGSCELQLAMRAEHINFNGTVHGGLLFSLADSAFGVASNSHGILSAGIDTHMTFHAAAFEGDVLTATATEVSRSRKVAVYRVNVTRQNGESVGALTGTVYRTGKPNHSFPEA